MRVDGTGRTKWTAEEERRLLELRAAGRSDAEIAKLSGERRPRCGGGCIGRKL